MGRLWVSPCLGMCQREGGCGEKSLRMDSVPSALWDQAHQSRVTVAEPHVSPLEQIQAQSGFLPILQVSPFKARAKAAPTAGDQGYPAHV